MRDKDMKTASSQEWGGSSDLWLWLLALWPEYWIAGAIAIFVVTYFDLPQEKTEWVFWVALILVVTAGMTGLAYFAEQKVRRLRSKSDRPEEPRN